MNPYRRPTNSGFTLLELLVVLLLLSLGTTIAILSLSSSQRRQSFNTTVKELGLFLKEARAGAILKQKVLTLYKDEKGEGLFLTTEDNETIKTFVPPEGIIIEMDPIVFFPDGSTGGGTVKVSSNNRRYTIIIDEATGIARTKKQ